MLSGFVNSDICKKAYTELVNKYLVVYQSPVRINKNSDNPFFFCVFDTTEAPKNQPVWPDLSDPE